MTINGVKYEFRDCIGKILKCSGYVIVTVTVIYHLFCLVMGRVCQYNRAKFPKTCHYSTFACYSIEWYINGYGIQRFKMCPTGEFPGLFR